MLRKLETPHNTYDAKDNGKPRNLRAYIREAARPSKDHEQRVDEMQRTHEMRHVMSIPTSSNAPKILRPWARYCVQRADEQQLHRELATTAKIRRSLPSARRYKASWDSGNVAQL